MERYIEFNPVKFLRESSMWPAEAKALEDDIESLKLLNAITNSEGRGSNISKPTESGGIKMAELTEDLKRIKHYQSAFEYAWNSVQDSYRELLQGFFFENRIPMWRFVRSYGTKYGYSERDVYRQRREALREFSRMIERYEQWRQE